MASLGFAPKHILIADRLRKYITEGKVRPGERLKPDTKLALEYGVNKQTVANGMALLVEEGLISRSPGRGTIALRNRPPENENKNKSVGVVVFSKGHVWQDMSKTITSALFKRNLYPVFVSEDFLRPYNTKLVQEFMKKLIQDGVLGFIIDGDEEIPFEFLKRNLSRFKNLVFIDHYQYGKKIEGAKYILTDYEKSGREAARYMIKNGHRAITFFPNKEKTKVGFIGSPQQQIIKGMKDACKKNKITFIDQIPDYIMRNGLTPEIYSMMENKSIARPTAALAIQDALIINELLPSLLKMGMKLPEDMSLIGFYNTPWGVNDADFLLSTFSIREDFQAETAVKMFNDEITETEMTVAPELIKRNSVVARRKCANEA